MAKNTTKIRLFDRKENQISTQDHDCSLVEITNGKYIFTIYLSEKDIELVVAGEDKEDKDDANPILKASFDAKNVNADVKIPELYNKITLFGSEA